MGQIVKYIEKNDGYKFYNEGDKIDLYVDPRDIMQF